MPASAFRTNRVVKADRIFISCEIFPGVQPTIRAKADLLVAVWTASSKASKGVSESNMASSDSELSCLRNRKQSLANYQAESIVAAVQGIDLNRLAEAMADAETDQSQLARDVGCTPGAINQIVNGGSRRSRFLPDIADVLGVSLRWLMGDDVPRDPLVPRPPRPTTPAQVVMMGVMMPPERALARMFEALLAGIDPQIPRAEQALLLAQRLPIGLSQLRDLLPESAQPRSALAQEDAGEAPATPRLEPLRR